MGAGRPGCPAGLGELLRLLDLALGPRRVDGLAALLAARDEGRLGRPRLSRLLGIGDRKARNILSKLAELGLMTRSPGGSGLTGCAERLLRPVRVLHSGEATCCIVRGRRGEGSPVAARDSVAILLGDPGLLVVLGYVSLEEGYEAPGVPEELREAVLASVKRACGPSDMHGGEAAYAVFRDRLCYLCCASFIHAALASSMLASVETV